MDRPPEWRGIHLDPPAPRRSFWADFRTALVLGLVSIAVGVGLFFAVLKPIADWIAQGGY